MMNNHHLLYEHKHPRKQSTVLAENKQTNYDNFRQNVYSHISIKYYINTKPSAVSAGFD